MMRTDTPGPRFRPPAERRAGWFERRLLTVLILFSLVPTLLLIGIGTALLGGAVSLQTTPAGWERLGDTGRELLEQADLSGDSVMLEAAQRHRAELTASIQQAQRWGYLNRRVLRTLPWLALGFASVLILLALRSARRIARDLSRPIGELTVWAGIIGRGESLPPRGAPGGADAGEFGVLKESFRSMAEELETSRAREIEATRIRASVGLARAVAHELKNALTPLRFAVHALQTRSTLSPIERESLEVIDAESGRLDALARAFSQFGSPPEGPRSEIDLGGLLEYLARTHLPPHITAQLDLSGGVSLVHGYYESLSRAFANLLLNAVEAIGDAGGSVEITLASAADGDGVEVRIADSGPGFAPGDEDRIWDPDFTTKASGTGLGLALVRQTVHAHGGRLSATNGPRGGAEFRVFLPARGAPVSVEAEGHHAPQPL